VPTAPHCPTPRPGKVPAQAAAEDERSLAALIRFLLRQYLDQRRAVAELGARAEELRARLTEQEAAILKAIAEGRSYREVAQEFGINPAAVAIRLREILEKVGGG
jgi:DNA-binding NarL/FixJ family response regulator